ncbi:hypothetical protein PV11_07045 [Exophiala sideris]|uniref:alpha-1,2-Mannosidase n=1 Tax=Exophiala sideris TaxID=1016849 RepID=A0A0D1VTM1_9EURO|nr:hypothetical protein PV11_07045 [Exophiala sideris]
MSWSTTPTLRWLRPLLALFVVFLLLQIFIPRSTYTRIQHNFKGRSFAQPERQNAVKREFLHAWTGYQDHAWMADGLLPLSGGRKQQFCGWSATLVDALDTLIIMDLNDEFQDALNATLTIDFLESIEGCEVNLFESTIRYLGGLMAAYELSNDARILPKLIELGDMLHTAFHTSNGLPCTHCKLLDKDLEIKPTENAILADVGSIYLEFARLSQITQDDKYIETVDHVSQVFAKTQNDSSIPGLWPEIISPAAIGGERTDFARKSTRYALGALSDSAYEYLVKTHLLLGKTRDVYESMWKMASREIKRFLLFRAYIPGANETDIIFPGIASRVSGTPEAMLETRTEHLACFAGGMFAMASRIFGNPEDFYIGEAITNGCVWAYQNSPTGIMPETFTLLPCTSTQQCEWSDSFWQEQSNRPEHCMNGDCQQFKFPPGYLQVSDASYKLRPEAIESVFIMWRMTGDEYWRDVGWGMFESIIEHTRSAFGHAALLSAMEVFDRDAYEKGLMVRKVLARQTDDMESFWFAETLKYFYLLFSEPDLISLDDWVLNTEAHPFRLTEGIRGF